jgi:hypothetical protein
MVEKCKHIFKDLQFVSCVSLGLGANSYAQMPIPVEENGLIKVYFTSRDSAGRSLPFEIEIDPETLLPKGIANSLQVNLGDIGTFDEDGVMPSSLVESANQTKIYYIGWNRGTTAPYRLSIGLLHKRGGKFTREFLGPILDRSTENPFFVTTPHVFKTDAGFKMLYSSGIGWTNSNSRQESLYGIREAVSTDGITWTNFREINLGETSGSCIARPYFFEGHVYSSERNAVEFRGPGQGYRIKINKLVGETTYLECTSSWENDLVSNKDRSYSSLIRMNGKRLVFYNGECFGKTGFLIAEETVIE